MLGHLVWSNEYNEKPVFDRVLSVEITFYLMEWYRIALLRNVQIMQNRGLSGMNLFRIKKYSKKNALLKILEVKRVAAAGEE